MRLSKFIAALVFSTTLLLFVSAENANSQIPAPGNPACAYCGAVLNSAGTQVHKRGCPYYVDPKSDQGGSSKGSSSDVTTDDSQSIERVITTSIMESLFKQLLSPTETSPAKSPEQLKREQEEREKEVQERVMKWNVERDRLAAEMKGAQVDTKPFSPKGSPPDQIELKPIPLMGGSPMTADERERQSLIKRFGPQYIDQRNLFHDISAADGITPDQSPSWDENSSVNKRVSGMIDNIGENPNGVLAAYIGKTELRMGKNVFKYLDEAKDAVTNGTEAELVHNNPNPEQTVIMETVREEGENKIEEVKGNVTEQMNAASANAGEKIITSMYGKQGAKAYKTTLNVISKATEISDNVKSAADWLGSYRNDNR